MRRPRRHTAGRGGALMRRVAETVKCATEDEVRNPGDYRGNAGCDSELFDERTSSSCSSSSSSSSSSSLVGEWAPAARKSEWQTPRTKTLRDYALNHMFNVSGAIASEGSLPPSSRASHQPRPPAVRRGRAAGNGPGHPLHGVLDDHAQVPRNVTNARLLQQNDPIRRAHHPHRRQLERALHHGHRRRQRDHRGRAAAWPESPGPDAPGGRVRRSHTTRHL
mmetsp:Transcript_17148/g.33689  ORF Transcript_17148/g.33689 Transcript_17148/m.33689 type:complete len:221 (-) Transcript_17148:53-715(-)